ncbi:hypothetical protein BHUM_06187c [Candidatus Burkholderia humilis]|nr:hypothetical protein BHUM_06187c [Candidatus Burkholderia humilis]
MKFRCSTLLFCMFVLLKCLLHADAALATCSAPNVNVPVPATLTIQRDAPVGTILRGGRVQTVNRITCNKNSIDLQLDGSWWVFPAASNRDNGATSLSNVRATGYPGVGIRWANLNSYTGTTQYFSAYSLASGNTSTSRRGIDWNAVTTFTDTFEFVKTGPISSGTLAASSYALQYSTPVSKNVQNAGWTLTFFPRLTFRCSAARFRQAILPSRFRRY